MAQPIKRYNITVATDSYERNWEKKYKWSTIGEATMWDDESISFDIYTIPVPNGSWKIWWRLFPREANNTTGPSTSKEDLDMPF